MMRERPKPMSAERRQELTEQFQTAGDNYTTCQACRQKAPVSFTDGKWTMREHDCGAAEGS
jgi:hypothetical protein